MGSASNETKKIRVRRRKPFDEPPTEKTLAKKSRALLSESSAPKSSVGRQSSTQGQGTVKRAVVKAKMGKSKRIKSDLKDSEKLISNSMMKKCILSLLKEYSDQDNCDAEGKKSVFAEASSKISSKRRLCLTIDSFKVPPHRSSKTPTHPKIFRFKLPHGLTDASSSVLLVTKDYPKPKNPRLSNEHFRRLLTSAGCNHLITEIMSIGQLRDEYSVLSARKELCDRIDVVLCDNSVSLVVPRVLGKLFLLSKKFPIGIKMNKKKLLQEIEEKLDTTCHKMTFKNTQSTLVFGHSVQPLDHLVENLRASIAHLCKSFPGGFRNIKTLYLTTGLKARVPLYVSSGPSSQVRSLPLMPVATPEILEGDFGFGNVKITSFGDVIHYQPIKEDEEDLLHAVPGMDEKTKEKYRKMREARDREERLEKIWAKKKRYGYGLKKEALAKAKRIKKSNFKEVPLV
ncbi:ribosomal L1 domain-containing protein CG13096 [Hyalella azteca]|uniref:Ribosomal L1 domain-containing protein CG13096 n=1 Tax=Hyalella azteca TaxID=294128 RepID=A0A8B7N192_HYAAZ|nr:ribosomal L1 domain-containing protein CG13096 [Hyalella azteca]